MVTIALVALLVFGPQRLPDITRTIGKIGREVLGAANQLKSELEREVDESRQSLDGIRRHLGSTVDEQTEPEEQ